MSDPSRRCAAGRARPRPPDRKRFGGCLVTSPRVTSGEGLGRDRETLVVAGKDRCRLVHVATAPQ